MTRRPGRRSGAAAALVTAVLALAPASPARAAGADAGPTITIDQPAADATSDTASVTFAGSATVDLALYQMRDIVLSAGGQTSPTITCSNAPCPFTWKATFAANGPYTLQVKATETALLLGTPVTGTASRSFAVNAPPQKPVLDPPRVTDGRTVELSWSRNPEPDLLYYAVFRKDPAGSKFLQIGGKVSQPASGKVTFTDTTTTFNGGDYAYQVVAVRKGATAGAEVSSAPSTAGAATVPPPPTTSTTVPAPGTPTAGPTTTAKPGPPAGVDLSGFLSSRAAPVSIPPATVPEAPDTGFQSTLPFGARPPGDDVEDGAGQEAAAPPRTSTSVLSRGSAGRPLVPIAAGLILLVLAMHMRTLSRRLKAAPAGDLPVDLDGPSPPPAPAVRPPAPVAAPVVAPPPYDADDEEDEEEEEEDDAAWAPAPQAAAPRPPAPPELEPEPDPEPIVAAAPEPEAPPAQPEPDVDWLYDLELDELDVEPEAPVAPAVEPELLYDLEPEVEERWDLTDSEPDPAPDLEPDPEAVAGPAPAAADEIEIVEVVSPTRRHLARAGRR